MYADAWQSLNQGDLNGSLSAVNSVLQSPASPDIYWHWKFIALKAEILLRQRRTGESLALLQPELPASLAGTDVDLWRKMTLGMGHAYNLNFAQSEKLLAQAKSLSQANHPDLLGEVLLRQGTLAWLQHDFQTATSLYQAALQSARANANPALQTASLGNLGMVATNLEHYDESLEWNRLALEKARAIPSPGHEGVILLNIGWSYRELGDYDNALTLFEQARVSAKQTGNVRLEVDALINAGNVYLQQHNYEAAKTALQQALALATTVSDQNAMASCYENLANIGLAVGDIDFAKQNEDKLAEFIRQHPDHELELYSYLDQGILLQARKEYQRSEALLQRVLRDEKSSAPQKWEAHALLAKTYGLENRASDAEHEYRQSLRTINQARSSLNAEELRLSFLSTPIEVFDSYIDFLVEHQHTREALQVAESSRAMTLEEGLGAASQSAAVSSLSDKPELVAKKLGSILFVYWVGQEHSYLWVVTPAKVSYFPLPKKSEIDPVLKTYRQEILDGRDVLGASSDSGKRLYQMLVEPARALIAKDSRVILLPAESLYGLNFETLIVPDPTPHFWIEDVTLSTASSLALLSTADAKAATKDKSLLLVGNPQSPSADFPALAQAPAEMTKVSAHFAHDREEMLDGPRATPSSYLASNPARFSYLHFVTHGTASHTRPLESAVILSKEGDSYKLYARDIVKHPLSADLVTISACNGAGTRAYAGEGLVGLSWAFLRAGAHNVIGALWEVSDATSTPQLMDSLYTGLDHGQDPATALRNAKLAILHATGASVFKKPFYWAPFQLYTGS
jgi:CHAT domain-containing protein